MAHVRQITIAFGLAVLGGCAAVPSARPAPQNFVWVCHGGRNAKWQRVGAPAADAHRRQSDPIGTVEQPAGSRCDR